MSEPIVLIAVHNNCHDGQFSAHRNGEPSFTHVQGLADAMMAALARGVDLIIPAELLDDLESWPPDLPLWIKIHHPRTDSVCPY